MYILWKIKLIETEDKKTRKRNVGYRYTEKWFHDAIREEKCREVL